MATKTNDHESIDSVMKYKCMSTTKEHITEEWQERPPSNDQPISMDILPSKPVDATKPKTKD